MLNHFLKEIFSKSFNKLYSLRLNDDIYWKYEQNIFMRNKMETWQFQKGLLFYSFLQSKNVHYIHKIVKVEIIIWYERNTQLKNPVKSIW